MTKIITRYFDSASAARGAKASLIQTKRFPPRIVSVYDSAEGLADTLTAAHVDASTAQAYADKLADGGAVVLVRAGFQPLGVARIARETLAERGAAAMPDLVEEVEVKDAPNSTPLRSVLSSHPLLMTRPRRDSKTVHMAEWPIPLISKRKPFPDAILPSHPHFAAFLVPLISRRKPRDRFAFPRHARMARFPIGLLVPGQKYMAKFPFAHIVPGHKHMASFPIPLLSKRKPWTRSIFPRHQRMATVPFPLLITDKPGGNALVPGHKHMANFPIGLISKRKPADKFAFPRHARMASFPIPLISRRKPADKYAFPRHAHMADIGLPLIIRKGEAKNPEADKTFSFSRMFGMPTVIRR